MIEVEEAPFKENELPFFQPAIKGIDHVDEQAIVGTPFQFGPHSTIHFELRYYEGRLRFQVYFLEEIQLTPRKIRRSMRRLNFPMWVTAGDIYSPHAAIFDSTTRRTVRWSTWIYITFRYLGHETSFFDPVSTRHNFWNGNMEHVQLFSDWLGHFLDATRRIPKDLTTMVSKIQRMLPAFSFSGIKMRPYNAPQMRVNQTGAVQVMTGLVDILTETTFTDPQIM